MTLHTITLDPVAVLDRPRAARVPGQLAAFPLDVPADPDALQSAAVPAGVQGALFDPVASW